MSLVIPSIGRRVKPHSSRAEAIAPVNLARFSVEQYHRMIRSGALNSQDRVELIKGWIVQKMPIFPPHRHAVTNLYDLLKPLFPAESLVLSQNPITLSDSEPEPDFTASAPPKSKYDNRNPGPDDVYLVAEVSDSSLTFDRTTKLQLYASAGIPVYWIVNLIDKQIEVYTKPKAGKKPGYGKMTVFKLGDEVPVMVAGKKRGTIAVSDVMP